MRAHAIREFRSRLGINHVGCTTGLKGATALQMLTLEDDVTT
jgi:hypothetical protein